MKKKMTPYLFVNMLAFYLLPMIIRDTGTAMVVMLVGIPLICVTVAIVYGAKNGFTWRTVQLLPCCLLRQFLFSTTIQHGFMLSDMDCLRWRAM